MHASLLFVPFLAVAMFDIAAAAPDSGRYRPAAREHVRMVDGAAWRYTSRLTTVLELNFTFGEAHADGKVAISKSLARIADSYGAEGKPALRIHKIQSRRDGTEPAPSFTLGDLLQGEVLVANNIGYLGLGGLGEPGQTALKAAIDSVGLGYLAFHSSAQSSTGDKSMYWSWYHESLEPRDYRGHSTRNIVPVYAHLAEAKHVVLQDVLTANTFPAEVPNETAADGSVIYARNVPVRNMKYESYGFGKDITRDPAYKDKVTLLLKHDERQLDYLALDLQYRRPGGGVHSYLYRVGKGLTAYIPAGHEDDEIMKPGTGFDGGVGDFDRYVAQLLFFLAGYDRTPCDASCEGLALVDGKFHLLGAFTAPPLALPAWKAPADPTKSVRHLDGTPTYLRDDAAEARDGLGRSVPGIRPPSGLKGLNH